MSSKLFYFPFLFLFACVSSQGPHKEPQRSISASDPTSTSIDGSILSQKEYDLPDFEHSGFRQAPDVQKFYEETIRPQYNAMKAVALVSEIFYSSDGLRVKGYILSPRASATSATPLPIIVYNRGGNRDYGKLTIHDLLWLSHFMQKGYLIVASQYRGVEGGEGIDEFGGNDLHDVANILKVAKALPQTSPQQTYIMGHSRGGMMTYLSLKDSHEFNAAVILAGECDLKMGLVDWPDFEQNVYAEIIPNYVAQKDEELSKRSACAWPQKISTPVYILQGDHDTNVRLNQAQMMERKLKALHKPVKLEIFPGGDHKTFFVAPHSKEIVTKIDRWFRSHPSR